MAALPTSKMEVPLHCCLLLIATSCVSYISSQTTTEIVNCKPPSMKFGLNDIVYFMNGMDVQIPCKATGSGQLSYTWYKNGQVLDLNNPDFLEKAAVGPGTGTLNIIALESDEGVYQCVVTNKCGTSLSKKVWLLMAIHHPFPFSDSPRNIRGNLGSPIKLSCIPPKSVPRAKITWILKFMDKLDDEERYITDVPLDSRVTMDYDGNLYITNLRKEDEQGGGIYVCHQENFFMRSTNIGEETMITVQGVTVSDRGVDLLWHSGNETVVLVGRRARLKCIFSGHPEPTISWSRLTGGELEKNRMTYDGNELGINDVQYKDAGQYQCTGRNVLSPDSKSHVFKLTVEASPQWKSQPRDITAGVEESASFECDATGLPEPTVFWYINGKPYDELPPNPNRVLKDNTMTFTNLEKDDSQVIQCNASNIHGHIWSNVVLAVEAVAFVFKQKPPEKLVIAEGHPLVIPCHVEGRPKPRVVWYKGSQPLVHDRYKILDHGDLFTEAEADLKS